MANKKSQPPILLIDGDVIAYQAAAASEKIICFDEDNCFPMASLEDAIVSAERRITNFRERFQATSYYLALTDAQYFRKEIYPSYKANRAGKPKPVCLSFLKNYLIKEHPTYVRPWLEGDDILGLLATTPKIIPEKGERIIISIDKDFKSIPGRFYDFNKDVDYQISPAEAAYHHMLQTLTGDTTDGYPGCPGCGPKTAEKLLADLTTYEAMWLVVVAAYEKAGLSEETALTQARLARICQRGDYDFKKKEVKLWQPPKM